MYDHRCATNPRENSTRKQGGCGWWRMVVTHLPAAATPRGGRQDKTKLRKGESNNVCHLALWARVREPSSMKKALFMRWWHGVRTVCCIVRYGLKYGPRSKNSQQTKKTALGQKQSRSWEEPFNMFSLQINSRRIASQKVLWSSQKTSCIPTYVYEILSMVLLDEP